MNSPFFAHSAPAHATYGVGDLMRRLGQEYRGTRPRTLTWQLNYLRDLIANADFPTPLPLRIRERGSGTIRLTDQVQRASRWQRRAVDQWFDDQLPPGAAAADTAERRAGETIMDERALAIGLRMVDGGRR